MAPLKKVVARELWHAGSTMSVSSKTVTYVAHYRTKFTLECGQIVMGPHAAPKVAAKRCKKCEAAS